MDRRVIEAKLERLRRCVQRIEQKWQQRKWE